MPSSARPHVTLHFAQSLDGRIAFPAARTILSSMEGVALAHRARAEHDAVLVGSRTVAIDDPRLTVRACPGRHPKRVILAGGLRVNSAARALEPGPGVLILGVQRRAADADRARLAALGAEVRLVAESVDGLVSLPAALAEMRAWGVERLLVEGGARILTAFVRERLADEVTVEIAPRIYGEPGVSAFGPLGVQGSAGALDVRDWQIDRAGASLVIRGSLGR